MREIDHNKNIENIFRTLNQGTMELAARESSSLEFKEAFNWGSKDKYAKTMVAYANNKGGYIVYGVTNQPRRLVGLAGSNFENLDEATITAYLNATFAPQIVYEKFVLTIQDVKVGFLYTHECEEKPVMPLKNDGDIKEAGDISTDTMLGAKR